MVNMLIFFVVDIVFYFVYKIKPCTVSNMQTISKSMPGQTYNTETETQTDVEVKLAPETLGNGKKRHRSSAILHFAAYSYSTNWTSFLRGMITPTCLLTSFPCNNIEIICLYIAEWFLFNLHVHWKADSLRLRCYICSQYLTNEWSESVCIGMGVFFSKGFFVKTFCLILFKVVYETLLSYKYKTDPLQNRFWKKYYQLSEYSFKYSVK